MKVLHAKSVRANLARVRKAQLKLAAKIDALNDQAKDLLELRVVLERQLPVDEQPVAYIRGAPAYASRNMMPDTHEQPVVDCFAPECPVHHGGSAPYCPLDFDAAAQAVERDARLLTEQDIRDAVERLGTNPATNAEQASGVGVSAVQAEVVKAMGDAIGERLDAIIEGRYIQPSKPGWPLGLSRARTPCPHSPIPHRHRKGQGNELTCVDIIYPGKAVAQAQEPT